MDSSASSSNFDATSLSWKRNQTAESLEGQAALLESRGVELYHPPGSDIPFKRVDWVYNPSDGSVLMDHKGRPISVDRILATKPLRSELSTRPGPGNKKLTYISGDGVTRVLNDVFGFDGWNLDITRVTREECLHDKNSGKYTVTYTAMVKVTHSASGTYKEDCGSGDCSDRNFGTAVSHALKGSITDAMKRAARHFGEKLGNSLYNEKFSLKTAPVSLKDALDKFEIEQANSKFGFPKNQDKVPSLTAPQAAANVAANRNSGTNTMHRATAPAQHQGGGNNGGRVLPVGPANSPAQQVAKQSETVNRTLARPANGQVLPAPPNASRSNGALGLEEEQQAKPQTLSNPQGHNNPPYQNPTHSKNPPVSHANNSQCDQRSHPSHDPTQQHQSTNCTSKAEGAPQSMAAAPPPTPMDSLRNSALFHSVFGYDDDDIDRPRSSYGRPQQSATVPANDPRRSSTGNGLPSRPASLVTPTVGSKQHKRPALESISNLDPTVSKRPVTNTSNPYHSTARM